MRAIPGVKSLRPPLKTLRTLVGRPFFQSFNKLSKSSHYYPHIKFSLSGLRGISRRCTDRCVALREDDFYCTLSERVTSAQRSVHAAIDARSIVK